MLAGKLLDDYIPTTMIDDIYNKDVLRLAANIGSPSEVAVDQAGPDGL